MNRVGAFLASALGRVVMVALVVGLVLVTLNQCQNARRAGQQANLNEKQAEAVSDSAADAIGTVGAVSGRQQDSDDLTRSNADAIDQAEGASDAVNPSVHGAGLDGLCRRAAYRSDPRCVQQPDP
ncbi:hypothetical protein [Aurantiacibacter zhengii]|uniref:Uncharacterized protein n=1 Tax=Aurantiacibacter zhengii TaxID=2307003 RepID=A0A418NTZ0_9SPHN|nr:hypothetical protein [Aurantiacibacter zhengii]RIV87513.1 hypothetical protein D2V07_03945 [Aurantiacibacter zhengii]